MTTCFSIENFTAELNDQQKEAVRQPLKFCTKIVAGAGTGKTKIISKRFVKLIFDLIEKKVENPLSHILVITFTQKAAQEMKERILKELEANGISSQGEQLWISTFHSFGNRFLKEHAIEANLSSGYKTADEGTLEKIWQELIKKIEYVELDFIDNLDDVATELGVSKDVLLSGNVTTLFEIDDLTNVFQEIFYIIKKVKALGLLPKDFLIKAKAATLNFAETVKTLPFKGKTKEEFFANWENHLKNFKDDFCSSSEFEELAKSTSVLTKNGSRKPEAWTKAEHFDETVDNFCRLEFYLIELIALVYALFQNSLEARNVVDFDDLINKPVEILRAHEDLRAYYQNYFEHIIIDEFQDTNGAQLELIKLLLPENEPNITFVGDRKQSIYGFRFAQMENLDTLHEFIEKKYDKKFPPIKLETNYRSSAKVLAAVNAVTKYQLGLDEEINPPDGKLISEKDVKKTTLTDISDSFEHNQKEAHYIAKTILNLKEKYNANLNDFAILVQSHKSADFFAKELAKFEIETSKVVNTAFFKEPTVKNVLALLRLAKYVFDEQAFVRTLQIHLSDSQMYNLKKFVDEKIYESEYKEEIKSVNLAEKVYFAYSRGFLNTEFSDFETIDFVNQIFNLFEDISRNFKNAAPIKIFYKIVNEIKPYKALSDKDVMKNEKQIEIIEKIITDFENNENFVSLTALFNYFEKIKNDKSFELPKIDGNKEDAVKLLTIYASKGLEFEHVFVTSIKKRLQNDKSKLILDMQYGTKSGFGLILRRIGETKNPKAEIYSKLWHCPRGQNERIRLFYVALSRAKNYLDLMSFEKYAKTLPAEFVEDLRMSF